MFGDELFASGGKALCKSGVSKLPHKEKLNDRDFGNSKK